MVSLWKLWSLRPIIGILYASDSTEGAHEKKNETPDEPCKNTKHKEKCQRNGNPGGFVFSFRAHVLRLTTTISGASQPPRATDGSHPLHG